MKSCSYEDYQTVAKHYDAPRQVVALDEILSQYHKHSSLELQHILDIGCGTGNYLIALAAHVKSGLGLDVSEAMLHCFE